MEEERSKPYVSVQVSPRPLCKKGIDNDAYAIG